MKAILFIGPIGGGRVPKNGASVKNYYTVHRLMELGYRIKCVDTENWRKNPLIFIQLLQALLFAKGKEIIISSSYASAYKFIRIVANLTNPNRITYWVIGGHLAQKIISNHFQVSVYQRIRLIIVEGQLMQDELKNIGITNTVVVPNYKAIGYIPSLPKKQYKGTAPLRFVFLSRIRPEKGCDLIIDACEKLNTEGLNKNFSIEFYGPVEESYKEPFMAKINNISNITYKGFLDLRDSTNYDELVKSDVFLFPTFWETEGFPGILIDAMIGGLPIVASDWNLNSELIEKGKDGFIIPPKDVDALYMQMKLLIKSPEILTKMRETCQQKAKRFSVEEVLSDEKLMSLGL